MKYVVLLSDGMAGRPIEQLGGRTTLEASHTPTMDRLAATAEVGLAAMVPRGMAPGSDTANLSVMGYDPRIYYTGRSPLEALSIGVEMEETDVSVRCNLVTLSEETTAYEDRKMLDHSAGEISTEEAKILIEAVKKELGEEGYEFHVGTSYRHLLLQKQGSLTDLIPPHDILGQTVGSFLPKEKLLRDKMKKSYDILSSHPINQKRKAQGKNPANSIWFWGAGSRPSLDSFLEKTGKKGIMISAVDLLKGIAAGAGMDVAAVEGANGGLHTNYEGKAKAALDALIKDGYDFAYIHVEAPDEMGHQGLVEEKMKAIEYVDQRVLRLLVEGMEEAKEDVRILVLPDHPTPIAVRTHTADPVPYLLYDSTRERAGVEGFSERTAGKTGISLSEGYRLIERLFAV